VPLVVLGSLRRRTVVLGVRQDTIAYYTTRATTPRRSLSAAIALLDSAYRLLARPFSVTVVGNKLAGDYRRSRAVLPFTVNLVDAASIAPRPNAHTAIDMVNLMSVGRLDREKSPQVLVEAIARLNERSPGRYRLSWFGRGPLFEATLRHAEELGIASQIDFRDYVPFGPALLDAYREADVFVHVAATEGVPQVVLEAMACGTPVVATAVGGLTSHVFRDVCLLVAPNDVGELVSAIEDAASNSLGGRVRVRRALRYASSTTREKEAARVAAFVGNR
jgi:glycosyltransferase involved in cell wall biosynthesis